MNILQFSTVASKVYLADRILSGYLSLQVLRLIMLLMEIFGGNLEAMLVVNFI